MGRYQLREEMLDRAIERCIRVIAVSGDLDMSATAAFEQSLVRLVAGDDPVILDLTEVTFMDSTAVAALISARKQANMTRERFAVVCAPGGDIERMLLYTGLDAAFGIAASRPHAAADLAAA